MKRYYVIITWSKRNAKKMLEVSSSVSEKMNGNENFTDPTVPMDVFDKKMARLQTAFNNRDNGKMARTELNEACIDMDDTLRTQALYVTNQSEGSLIIIQTSGFTASKGGSTRATVPSMPTDVKITSKNNNVTLIAKKPKGASSLCWVVYYGAVTNTVSVDNNSIRVPVGVDAQIISPGKARELIMNLQTGLQISAQVLAQNSAGKSALGDMVSVFVNR